MSSVRYLLLLGIFLAQPGSRANHAAEQGRDSNSPVISPEQIEADWLLQEEVRWLPPAGKGSTGSALKTTEDAAGGCDGIKDGTYGFHTNRDERPWWQVDLGKSQRLDRIVIYNRGDGVSDRASRLIVLTSEDGTRWSRLYQHDGTRFVGYPDGQPLKVDGHQTVARWVRLQLPEANYLHLDEVEVYPIGSDQNIALGRPADQSSVSTWSTAPAASNPAASRVVEYPVPKLIEQGMQLAADLRLQGVAVEQQVAALRLAGQRWQELARSRSPASPGADGLESVSARQRALYLQARWAIRRMALSNRLLDFDDLLLVKRVPGTFTHMSDQYYGWFSRPGGGLHVLRGFKTDSPKLHCLTSQFPEGSFLRPDISYDGRRVLFAFARYHAGVSDERNKLDKSNVPEDAFYHLFEMNVDGTGVRQLTRGKYDDFDGRYLPDDRIVFLSTRRGQAVQCTSDANIVNQPADQPDCYVRCGGGPERPVSVYTLHVMGPDGERITRISPFEMFEWTPSIGNAGQILYARWDYVDRYNMPYMSLWSTMPDGTEARALFGNYTRNPHCVFEARSVPDSEKIVFTASGHHAFTGGSLVLLDPNLGADGQEPMKRLTPEVAFPEAEGWPQTYFANPYPLSETHFLVSWSAAPLPPGTPRPRWGMPGPPNDLGIYLFDAFGNLNLIYRDPQISSMCPLPIHPRRRPPQIASRVDAERPQQANVLLIDVYRGLGAVPRGSIERLRLVGIPAKTHPTMNHPVMGLTRDDPGKFVIGTVPVEEDGSAFFRAPPGVAFFVQALDSQGMAVQTMRSAAYVQPGQTTTCIGCHESRHTAPPNQQPLAVGRPPSAIRPSVTGSWPLNYQVLVQPVLEARCVSCHQPDGSASGVDLTSEHSYTTLVTYGTPSLKDHVLLRYGQGQSTAGACAARANPLWKLLRDGHYAVVLSDEERLRVSLWMDTYGQRAGSFDPHQEQALRNLRHSWEQSGAVVSADR